MQEIYKGYEVALNKTTGKFKISLNGDELVTRDNWEAAVKYIDGQTAKDKKKFVPIEAVSLDWSKQTKGKITGLAEGNAYTKEQQVWFVSDKGERSKKAASNVVPITPQVLSDLREIELLEQAIVSTQKKLDKIKNALPRYQPEGDEK